MSHEQHIGSVRLLATAFREARSLYSLVMSNFLGWGSRIGGLFADKKGPWGTHDDGDTPPDVPNEGGPAGPWGEPPKRNRRGVGSPGANVTSIDELLRRGR